MISKPAKIVLITLLVPVFFACDRTRSSTGWDYMPDMYYSNAYESYTPNPNFEDGLTMREPVAGTVSRDLVPSQFEKTDEDRIEAGRVLVNPMVASADNVARGKEAYGIWCSSCHGVKGDGQGHLYTSERYPYPPADLIGEIGKDLKDGEIYHSISVGYGVMGSHEGMIRQEDRWKIILYLREELQK